ncbi:1,4-alpha-glucan branching protein GlgB [Streptomyces sp. NBC_00083]|uniref:1,4-alpha-glucan branching protein GlgB n=1 Tax=Streptomyces sp. NBC_00083 TaxID=2975647 RepID=UPI00225244B2|nr:1,4-alpha-glucan branching protein GlgB [Streptomyces sp. NBC_00083]MCX5388234.1 1,4-alpha-glucan branching protein GlgB [Streptomyces sp. NBC_00083]
MTTATQPSAQLAATDLKRLVTGEVSDPHALLGAHPAPGGTAVRVLRPFADAVTVTGPDGAPLAELVHQDGGVFTGLLPVTGPLDYRVEAHYGSAVFRYDDPYRFAPTLGDLDLHLIREGRHEELWRVLGATTRTHDAGGRPVAGTAFAVWAPNARAVRLTGDLNHWDGAAHPMRSLGACGVWELFVPGVGDGVRYKYEILTQRGEWIQKADPLASAAESAPGTASVVHTPAHRWGDAAWLARRGSAPAERSPMSVYEMHLGSWRPGLGYRDIARELPGYLKALGFTHVEFLPVAEHPFGGSWGYQVTSYFAPMAALGTPDDFRHLVDTLHQAGIGVIVDWVPAHFPRDDWALARFDGTALYEHGDPRRGEHPDWGTLVFDYGRPEVRNFLVANASYWCEEFHVDGVRVDAVASMLYLDYSREAGQWEPNAYGGREHLEAVEFLQEMNATVARRSPGVITIAEESTAWDGVTRRTDHGGLGFGLKWNMGWMHDALSYMAEDPVHRQYHHHRMTFPMMYAYAEHYTLPISHDEVVHGKGSLLAKMPGDRWQQLANLRAFLGFMWAFPGKQLLFMGQEFAQDTEWSHEKGPDWSMLRHAPHAGVRDLVRDLNHRYTADPALWSRDGDPEGFRWIDADAAEDNVYSFVRHGSDGELLVCVYNFQPAPRYGFRLALPAAGRWREVLNTDAAAYGGSGTVNAGPVLADGEPLRGLPASATVVLPPLGAVWLRPE